MELELELELLEIGQTIYYGFWSPLIKGWVISTSIDDFRKFPVTTKTPITNRIITCDKMLLLEYFPAEIKRMIPKKLGCII